MLGTLTSMLKTSARLRLENLASRQLLAVLRRSVLWWSFVKWAVCIITTNAAPPNAHPMKRQHRIECLQKIRRLRGVLRRRPDLGATRHFDESSQ